MPSVLPRSWCETAVWVFMKLSNRSSYIGNGICPMHQQSNIRNALNPPSMTHPAPPRVPPGKTVSESTHSVNSLCLSLTHTHSHCIPLTICAAPAVPCSPVVWRTSSVMYTQQVPDSLRVGYCPWKLVYLAKHANCQHKHDWDTYVAMTCCYM